MKDLTKYVEWEKQQHPWADDETAERLVHDELRTDPQHYERMWEDLKSSEGGPDGGEDFGHLEPDGDEGAPDLTIILGMPSESGKDPFGAYGRKRTAHKEPDGDEGY